MMRWKKPSGGQMRVTLDDYVTIAEAAALLKVHKSTIRRWIDQGDVAAYRIGQRRLALKRGDVARLVRPAARSAAARDEIVLPIADPSLAGLPLEEQIAIIRARRAEIPPLTPEQRERGLRAMEEARALREEILRRRNGELFSPSWEIINEFRDERSEQL
jgi:excisionase family DNA binding protein